MVQVSKNAIEEDGSPRVWHLEVTTTLILFKMTRASQFALICSIVVDLQLSHCHKNTACIKITADKDILVLNQPLGLPPLIQSILVFQSWEGLW